MNRKTFITVCLLLIGSLSFAQKVLEVKDISQPNDVYSSPNDEAAVIIRCHQSIPLRFISSMDKSAAPFRTELQGSDSVYYIAFPTGNRYRGRVLTIAARGFVFSTIPLELQPKQLLSFLVFDPNATVDVGCYREHRNKGVNEIKRSNYMEARNQFIVARSCSDVDKLENEMNIAMVDSLIFFRQKGDEAYNLLDYVSAGDYYSKILALNANDSYASNRNTLCQRSHVQECRSLFSKAEFYYTEKEFDKAKELYEKVVAKECSNMSIATDRINAINSLQIAKKDHARVFTYELRENVPLGFSYGKYNMHKVGGFFQMDFNTTLFDAIRSDCKYGDEKFMEANIAIGWTVKLYDYVWIHLGPGLTGKGYYGTYLSEKYPKKGYGETDLLDTDKMGEDLTIPKEDIPERYKPGWQKFNLGVAISPVVGITAKYSYFALRLSYQYRWAIQSKLQDFIGRNRFSVGVGVAF